jgi:Arc/MetJ family transcription regulator
MRTTLNIDEALLRQAMTAAGAGTRTEAIELGLQALVERAARQRLARLWGGIPTAEAPARRRGRPARR